MNARQNRTSNRFQPERNENRKETRCNHANFNEFLEQSPGPSAHDTMMPDRFFFGKKQLDRRASRYIDSDLLK
jgi:hypothetical protein